MKQRSRGYGGQRHGWFQDLNSITSFSPSFISATLATTHTDCPQVFPGSSPAKKILFQVIPWKVLGFTLIEPMWVTCLAFNQSGQKDRAMLLGVGLHPTPIARGRNGATQTPGLGMGEEKKPREKSGMSAEERH